jgi:AMMECR1 domain-containing protein
MTMRPDDMKLLATYALFGIRTINDANLEHAAQSKLSESSKSRFGVFVTLHRNENEIQLDDPGAREIHGCLGHWTPQYQSMTPADLVARMQRLIKDVRTKDDRRLNFDTDVDQDASATIEISFMNLPLREMDDASPETKTQFSNKKQGVLVDSGSSGKRATYLPGVFPNASWAYISQSLRQKAGLGRVATARFYAYDTTVVTFSVYEVLFSALSASYLRTDVAFFYLKHYADFVPYEYNAATKEARVDVGESVRNVACIGDVIGFAQDYRVVFENTPIIPNLEHYYQRWLKAPTAHRQASIFLIQAYNRRGVHRSRIQLMSAQLYAALDRNALEPRFEMGEAVSVLAQTSVPRVKTLKLALNIMRARAEDMLHAGTTPLDNVFELNWQSQSVHQLFKLEPSASSASRASRASNASKLYVDHAVLLFSVFVKTAQRTIVRLDSLETNYLAVIYECLSNVDAVMVLSEKHREHDQLAMVHDEIRNQRLRYFAALAETRRGEYGLYYFKDGKHARLDITGHVLDAP